MLRGARKEGPGAGGGGSGRGASLNLAHRVCMYQRAGRPLHISVSRDGRAREIQSRMPHSHLARIKAFYTTCPESLCITLRKILPRSHDAILLGFTRDGRHLVGYTVLQNDTLHDSQSSVYSLALYRFNWDKPLKLILHQELFMRKCFGSRQFIMFSQQDEASFFFAAVPSEKQGSLEASVVAHIDMFFFEDNDDLKRTFKAKLEISFMMHEVFRAFAPPISSGLGPSKLVWSSGNQVFIQRATLVPASASMYSDRSAFSNLPSPPPSGERLTARRLLVPADTRTVPPVRRRESAAAARGEELATLHYNAITTDDDSLILIHYFQFDVESYLNVALTKSRIAQNTVVADYDQRLLMVDEESQTVLVLLNLLVYIRDDGDNAPEQLVHLEHVVALQVDDAFENCYITTAYATAPRVLKTYRPTIELPVVVAAFQKWREKLQKLCRPFPATIATNLPVLSEKSLPYIRNPVYPLALVL